MTAVDFRPAKLQPLAHSPDRAAERLGISTRSVYNLIAQGELKSFKIGKRRLIPDPELERYVSQKIAAAAESSTQN